ncbi:hypothetical protein ACFQX7_10470 [Luedemannella flava]
MRVPVRRAGIAVLFVAIAATAALVTNLVWYGDDDPRPAVAAVDVPADGYAYLTDHELAVVRDATVVGRALGRFSNADPHWTGTGSSRSRSAAMPRNAWSSSTGRARRRRSSATA